MNHYELKKALESNKYILLRMYNNRCIGVNCNVLKFNLRKNHYSATSDSIFLSFIPITFQEYISIKVPFV